MIIILGVGDNSKVIQEYLGLLGKKLNSKDNNTSIYNTSISRFKYADELSCKVIIFTEPPLQKAQNVKAYVDWFKVRFTEATFVIVTNSPTVFGGLGATTLKWLFTPPAPKPQPRVVYNEDTAMYQALEPLVVNAPEAAVYAAEYAAEEEPEDWYDEGVEDEDGN